MAVELLQPLGRFSGVGGACVVFYSATYFGLEQKEYGGWKTSPHGVLMI